MSDTVPESLTGYRWLDRVAFACFVLVFGVTFIREWMGPLGNGPSKKMVASVVASWMFWVVVTWALVAKLGVI